MVRKNKQEIMTMIICTIVAFALWLYVMGDKNPIKNTVIDNVPVELVNTESMTQSNLALLPDQHFTVNLTVSGKAMDVFNLSSSDFTLVADMSVILKKGDNSIPVEVKKTPKGINVIEKGDFPYVVKVKLDPLIEKSIPVFVKVTGKAKNGYNYLQPVPRPIEVLVSGAVTYVNSVSLVLGSIDISNYSKNVTGSIPVKAVDSDNNPVSYVNIEPKYIDVTVPIKLSKEVPIVVKTTGKIPDGKNIKTIKPEFNSVTIMGDKKYLDKIKQIETTQFDISNLTATSSKDIMLNIPTNIDIFNDIRSINVNFLVEDIIEKKIDVPINYLNENSLYNYSLSTSTLALTVSGSASIINSGNINGVTASIDLLGYEEGTHNLAVKINLPEGLVVKVNPTDRVIVTVTKK